MEAAITGLVIIQKSKRTGQDLAKNYIFIFANYKNSFKVTYILLLFF